MQKRNQSASSIHRTKQASQMQRHNYLRALVVKLNE